MVKVEKVKLALTGHQDLHLCIWFIKHHTSITMHPLIYEWFHSNSTVRFHFYNTYTQTPLNTFCHQALTQSFSSSISSRQVRSLAEFLGRHKNMQARVQVQEHARRSLRSTSLITLFRLHWLFIELNLFCAFLFGKETTIRLVFQCTFPPLVPFDVWNISDFVEKL